MISTTVLKSNQSWCVKMWFLRGYHFVWLLGSHFNKESVISDWHLGRWKVIRTVVHGEMIKTEIGEKKRQNCRCISSFYISLFWKSTRWHILLETEAGWNTMYRQGRQETLLPSHHDSIHGVLSRVHLGESHRPTQGNRTYHSKSWSLVPSVSLL